MRKLFISALLALTLGISAFANKGNNVDFNVKNKFETQFTNASNVQWSEGKGYTKATFMMNNEKVEAFYNQQGEMIGTSKNASVEELPVSTKRTFAKKCEGYTVKEVIRFESADESVYYVSAENEKGAVIFKIDDNGYVSMKKM